MLRGRQQVGPLHLMGTPRCSQELCLHFQVQDWRLSLNQGLCLGAQAANVYSDVSRDAEPTASQDTLLNWGSVRLFQLF